MRATQLILVLGAGVLAGCAAKRPDVSESPGAEAREPTAALEGEHVAAGEQLTPEQAAFRDLERQGLVIYFDFDTADIRPEYRGVVAANAKFLGDHSARRLRLEGHADERGSREYNIGLGERRAQAVRRALMLQGAGDNQLTTISYGEERPATSGSDETAWSKNRRVELRYAP